MTSHVKISGFIATIHMYCIHVGTLTEVANEQFPPA